MNKNIKKLVLTTAGLTLGMFAVGNMSAENNVVLALPPGATVPAWDSSFTTAWDIVTGADGTVSGWSDAASRDMAETTTGLSGRVWFANTTLQVEYILPDAGINPIYYMTINTASDGSFQLADTENLPKGTSIIISHASRPYMTVAFMYQQDHHVPGNGGDVTPEPEKPSVPDNGGDVTPDFSTNTWEQNGSDWYCYDSNGYKITGWMQDGNNWYYFNQDGSMHKGWLESNGLWYSFRDNGQMKRGWEKINGTQYFFTDSGRLAYDEWLPYGSEWFYVNKKGRMLQNEWQPYNGSWFYFDAKGAMVTNQYVGGSYVDASGRAI